jgi:protein arginine kinase activator
MICDFCKKNIATVHLIRVQNDNVEKVNICSECARDFSFFSEDDFYKDLSNILSKIFQSDADTVYDSEVHQSLQNLEIKKNRSCPFCGTDLKSIKKQGKMGCPHCYNEFRSILLPIIKAIHQDTKYRGKMPETMPRQMKLEKSISDLRNRLQREIFIENFEEAARIRDEIKQLEKNIYE